MASFSIHSGWCAGSRALAEGEPPCPITRSYRTFFDATSAAVFRASEMTKRREPVNGFPRRTGRTQKTAQPQVLSHLRYAVACTSSYGPAELANLSRPDAGGSL